VRYKGAPFQDWATAKNEGTDSGLLPFGQVPSLTHHGVVNVDLVQSDAICSYLAREHGLYGANNAESAAIDVMIGGVKDLRAKWSKRMPYTATAEEVAVGLPQYLADDLPLWLGHLARLKARHGGKYMVGDTVTLADFYAFDEFDRNLRAGAYALFAEDFPALLDFVRLFANRPKIKAYLLSAGSDTPTARLPHTGGPDKAAAPGKGADYLAKILIEGQTEL
jgi:glutathione S-transferase